MSDALTEAGVGNPDKVYICPGCGAEYAEPTTCTNQHPPIEAVEYDKATVDAAKAAIAAGATEVTIPAAPQEEPVAPDAPAEPAADPAPPAEPTAPNGTPLVQAVADAFAKLEAAVAAAKAELGL